MVVDLALLVLQKKTHATNGETSIPTRQSKSHEIWGSSFRVSWSEMSMLSQWYALKSFAAHIALVTGTSSCKQLHCHRMNAHICDAEYATFFTPPFLCQACFISIQECADFVKNEEMCDGLLSVKCAVKKTKLYSTHESGIGSHDSSKCARCSSRQCTTHNASEAHHVAVDLVQRVGDIAVIV